MPKPFVVTALNTYTCAHIPVLYMLLDVSCAHCCTIGTTVPLTTVVLLTLEPFTLTWLLVLLGIYDSIRHNLQS